MRSEKPPATKAAESATVAPYIANATKFPHEIIPAEANVYPYKPIRTRLVLRRKVTKD
jgi:hypothetical protein